MNQVSTATDRVSRPISGPGSVHAEVRDGQIWLWLDGRFGPVDRWTAVSILWEMQDSPFPETQERVRQIRAALEQVTQ